MEFNIQAILQRIDEIHATMTLPVFPEEELIPVPTVAVDAIPVTPESVEELEQQAVSASLMAGFTRSILAGSSGQMSIDDFLEMPTRPAAPERNVESREKGGRGTNDFVLTQPISYSLSGWPGHLSGPALFNQILKGETMEATRCKKCGRPLRDPESIARGMGPECAGSHWRQEEILLQKKGS